MCSLITLFLPLSLLSSLSLSLSVLVSVTVLTKALIWGRWLLSMCRHPGCRGNQSKVVSKRQHRPLQCSRKTAAQVWTWSDGMHSSSHHDTHSHTILQTLALSLRLPLPPPCTWRCNTQQLCFACRRVPPWLELFAAYHQQVKSLGNQSEKKPESKHLMFAVQCVVEKRYYTRAKPNKAVRYTRHQINLFIQQKLCSIWEEFCTTNTF